jgi:hypothetical protein
VRQCALRRRRKHRASAKQREKADVADRKNLVQWVFWRWPCVVLLERLGSEFCAQKPQSEVARGPFEYKRTLTLKRSNMTDPIYLITGSTGTTGRVAVEQLLKDGKRVRAMIHKEDKRSAALRDLGAETVMGNFLELDEVKSAMEGATGAYFCYPLRNGLIDAAAFFAQAARECDLKSIVNMSQISARREAKSHAARDHWITEQVFNWSGVSSTHIRPTYFAEWAISLAALHA